LSLFILGLCSIFVGYIFFEMFNGISTLFFRNSIYLNINNYNFFDTEFSLFFVKFIPLILLFISFWVFKNYIKLYFIFENYFFHSFYRIFSKLVYFDVFYNNKIFFPLLYYSYTYFYKFIEKKTLELLVKEVLTKVFLIILQFYKNYDKVYIFFYIFIIIMFIEMFIFIIDFVTYTGISFNIIMLLFFFVNLSNVTNR
jgi:hypothetical protein